MLIFSAFAVPEKYYHRVLFWGILGASTVSALVGMAAGGNIKYWRDGDLYKYMSDWDRFMLPFSVEGAIGAAVGFTIVPVVVSAVVLACCRDTACAPILRCFRRTTPAHDPDPDPESGPLSPRTAPGSGTRYT